MKYEQPTGTDGNTQYILSLSYGKDSLACLESIKLLGLPLDRIVHAEVWATDTIPADLPPMVEFKEKADRIIKDRYGIDVEHVVATKPGGAKLSFENQFYTMRFKRKTNDYCIYGFPMRRGAWCNSRLKMQPINRIAKEYLREGILPYSKAQESEVSRNDNGISGQDISMVQFKAKNECNIKNKFSDSSIAQGAKTNIVQYLGIAADEPERIKRHTRPGIVLPLVEIGWDEAYCRQWCEDNDLLSPIYTTATRGGCWFCHNQSVEQLRLLRRNYPDLWQLLLKWDNDSPVSFRADGHTVHDFDKRFQMEDDGLIFTYDKFRWNMLEQELNYRWF